MTYKVNQVGLLFCRHRSSPAHQKNS